MKIREVVVKEELSEAALLVSSKVGVVRNARDTAHIIHLLGSAAPLEMFGLRHLKRVRKIASEPGTPSESAKPVIEVYICPSSAIADIPEDILSYFESPLRTMDVCQVKPRDRADRDAFGLHWPVIFRPTELSEEQEKGLCPEMEARMSAHLVSLLSICPLDHSSTSITTKSNVTIIVNPANDKVVIDTERAREFFIQRQEKLAAGGGRTEAAAVIAAHPLFTPVMMCIEGVAAIVRGDIPSTNSSDGSGGCSGSSEDSEKDICAVKEQKKEACDKHRDRDEVGSIKVQSATPETDQYVCTGLEAYLLREPTAMEAMALVHSRILRVIFLHRNPEQGALGSVFSLHRLASLNHRFRVFQGVPDKEEEKEERIPGVEGL